MALQFGPQRTSKIFERFITAAGIVHVGLDPMVALHRGLEENSASDMERLGDEIRGFARRTRASIDLIHHTVKNQSGNSERNAGLADAARGSGATVALARSVYTLAPMDKDTAGKLGLPPADAAQIVRLDDGKKNNTRRSGHQRWFQIQSVLPDGSTISGHEFESKDIEELRRAHSSAPVHVPFNFAAREALATFDKSAGIEKQTEALRNFVASMMDSDVLDRKAAVDLWGEQRGIKETMARNDIDRVIPRGRRAAVRAKANGMHQLLWSEEKQGRTKKIVICREITGQDVPQNSENMDDGNAENDLFG